MLNESANLCWKWMIHYLQLPASGCTQWLRVRENEKRKISGKNDELTDRSMPKSFECFFSRLTVHIIALFFALSCSPQTWPSRLNGGAWSTVKRVCCAVERFLYYLCSVILSITNFMVGTWILTSCCCFLFLSFQSLTISFSIRRNEHLTCIVEQWQWQWQRRKQNNKLARRMLKRPSVEFANHVMIKL